MWNEEILPALRLIKVDDYAPGQTLRIVMDDSEGKAVAFIDTRKKENPIPASPSTGQKASKKSL